MKAGLLVLAVAEDQIVEQVIPAFQWWITVAVAVLALVGLVVYSYSTRTGVIARAATKEAVRQPVFALLIAISLIILVLNTFLPFFSLGEDVKMLKDCGLATLLIGGLLLAIWTASSSVADEIEGKTAMTLLSKPINRRQFIVGKYLGIVQAVLWFMLPVILAFVALVFYKVGYDAREASLDPPTVMDRLNSIAQVLPGLVLIALEIIVMTAVSVAISTRLPMIVNLTACFAIFVVGHLTPVLLTQAEGQLEFVAFVARIIATILPSLELFNTQAAVATGSYVPPWYLLNATFYCAAYVAMAILFAFILFEDRDLA